jgi:membrane protein required for colicin V production
MENVNLTALDLVTIALVLISSIMAFARGFIREVFSIIALLGAGLAAYYGHGYVAPLLNGFFNSPTVAVIAAVLLLAIVTFVLITLLTSLLAQAVHKSGEIGAIDRGAGLVFGAIRGLLVMVLLVFVLNKIMPPDRRPDWLTDARSYPVLSQASDALESFIPKAKDYIIERRNGESSETAPT